jgi:hypothetical protein
MKKIVGILAAAAVAASAFAVDFSAGMQLKADLFNYDGVAETAQGFSLWNENSKDDKPFVFSISDERVGATLKIYDSEKAKLDSDMGAHAYSIWFKPFDMLRIDLGSQDIKLNCETISYWRGKLFGAGDWGYKATVNVDAFSVALAILPKNGEFWFQDGKSLKAAAAKKAKEDAEAKAKEEYKSKAEIEAAGKKAEADVLAADDPDAAIGEMALFAQYSADFGTVIALFDANDTFKDIKVGAGYKNTFGDLGMFADVAFFSKKANKDADPVNGLAIDADVTYSMDAFSAQGYVQWKANDLETIKKETMDLKLYAKLAYALNNGSVYFKFFDDDLFADKFTSDIHLGYDGNLGAMSYEVEAQLKTVAAGDDVKVQFNVPCYFRIGF